jgi:hypothetical protein
MDYFFDAADEPSPSTDSNPSFESQKNVFRLKGKKKSAKSTERNQTVFRTRRPHTKSRAGCKNCKERKIKARLSILGLLVRDQDP